MAGIGKGGNTIHPITRSPRGGVPTSLPVSTPQGVGLINPNPIVRRLGLGTTTTKPVIPIMRSRGPVTPVVHENHLPQFNSEVKVRSLGGDQAMGFEKFGT